MKAIPIWLKVVGAVLVAIFAIWVIWKLFFSERAARQKSEQVQTQGAAALSNAGQQSGKDAIRVIVDNGNGAAAVDRAVRGALNAIANSKGADQKVDPALDDVGRRAVCVRASAASLPDCQHLQRVDP